MKRIISVLLIVLMLFAPVSFAESDIKSELKLEATADGVALKGTPTSDGLLSKGDYISFLVIKPGYSFDALLGNDEIESALCYMETIKNPPLLKEFSFDVKFNDSMPCGLYTLKITVLKDDGTDYSAIYKYNRLASDDIDRIVNEFKTLTEDEFTKKVKKYVYDELSIDVSDIVELGDLLDDLGESFVIARDGLSNGTIAGEIEEIESLNDIKYCFKVAMALYSVTKSGDKKVYDKYSSSAPSFFDTKADAKEINEIYKEISDKNDTDDEKLKKVSVSNALSYVKDGSYSDIAYAIENYADVLGVDVEYMEENDVTALDVARYIDSKDISAYSDGMGDAVKEIVDKLKKKENGSNNSGGGSAGGGGGSKGSSSVMFEKEDAQKPEQIKNENDDEFVFDDLKNVDWAKDSVMNLYKKGIINGVSENMFEPNRAITREEFVKLAVSSFALSHKNEEKVDFADCKEGDWYYPYVQIAYAHGLINGMGDGTFGAGQEIKREDAAVICLKLLEIAGDLPTIDKDKKFADDDDISDYARLAVMSLSEAGVITGFEDGSFKPSGTTTRAQAAVIIERLMSLK